MLWYANRKQIPLEDLSVAVERDDSQERQRADRVYTLRVTLTLGGPLTEAQRQELLNVAGKCQIGRAHV